MTSLPAGAPAHLDRIRVEQIKSIYRNTAPGNIATFITVTVLTGGLMMVDMAVHARAFVFIGLMSLQTASRLLLIRHYLRRDRTAEDWRPWARWFTLGTLAGGITIGGGGVWIMSTDRTDLQLIALLFIFGCTSGAVGAFGAYLPAFYTFLCAISVVPVVWLFSFGDAWHVTIGCLVLLWFFAVGEQARRSSRNFVEVVGLRFENQDLVENLRREKALAEEANAAKSRFLAAASHDLRQPVHALTLFVAALRSHEMNREARGLLDHIDDSVRSMGGLFGGLLDISRLDAGVVGINRAPFPVQPLIDRVCRDYAADAAARGVRLRVRPTRAIVNTDPMLFERILRNVVVNAVTYTDSGRILVGCRRGTQLRVQVLDTGRGIALDEQQHVFQEFYQVSNPERDRTRGVGLGLAIVKRLTALLGHEMALQSSLGRGTCFTVSLPFEGSAVAGQLTLQPRDAEIMARGSGVILVVDDEMAIQVAMQSLLQSWGYTVVAAGSCAQMLERIATLAEVPRLILCDYRLRDNETGSSAIERLRSEYNEEIPGVLITGDTAPDRLQEAQASGYLLLHKPVANGKLRAAITHLVRAETA